MPETVAAGATFVTPRPAVSLFVNRFSARRKGDWRELGAAIERINRVLDVKDQ